MKNELSNYRTRKDLFDEAFDSFFNPTFFNLDEGTMKTDIKENNNGYTIDIEMPGYQKENITVNLEDGYLTVRAKKKEELNNEQDVKYLRRERSLSCSRSYYVGDIDEKEIKAKFDNGVLTLFIPKVTEKEITKHNITIE